jgi:hypothetical protein
MTCLKIYFYISKLKKVGREEQGEKGCEFDQDSLDAYMEISQ